MKINLLKTVVVYLGGLLTGLSLILYPALGPVFTDNAFFGFSNNQFSSIFIPQMVLAIFSALMTPFFVSKKGMKKVLFLGCLSLAFSLFLLFWSHFFIHDKEMTLMIIYAGTTFLGLGFGLVITILNPMAFQLFPNNELASISGLHFSLGLGTAGAPLLVGLLRNPNLWWYLPVIVGFLVMTLLIMVVFLKINETENTFKSNALKIPLRLWGFVLIVTLYGICEGTLGSFGAVFLKSQGFSIKIASIGLALFWSGLAIGRITFGLLSARFNLNKLPIVAALLIGFLFYLIPISNAPIFSLSEMAFVGVLMSSLFPSSVNWATKENVSQAVMVSGLLVAALQFGTGISINFLGFLSTIFPLAVLFKWVSIIAFGMTILMWKMQKTTINR